MPQRRRLTVRGIVQGVGFRPHVHRLVSRGGLTGTIANTTGGVEIEVQGTADEVAAFVRRLPDRAPPLARILSIDEQAIPLLDGTGFRILASRGDDPRDALIAPDVATCDDCLAELRDPDDRRFGFPFINCTHCGPRYTIVRDIPYDRPLTAMASFPVCEDCAREYADPADRRFHAQATTCGACGPRLALHDARGNPVTTDDPIEGAVAALRAGQVVAVKGLGGFHLVADALDADAVALLRERKRRVGKPFAVMVPDVERADRFCVLGELERSALESHERPIVLAQRRSGAGLAPDVAPGTHTLGVFLPYTPLHHLLFAAGGFDALVATSGNLSEEPIAIGNAEACTRLAGLADAFLVHDREILVRCDDSVTRIVGGRQAPVRRARGFVPIPHPLPFDPPPILAVGGEMKSTVTVTRGALAFVSQHVGDLENEETLRFFEHTTQHLVHLLGVTPRVIAHDLHPDYRSTQWARAQSGVPLVSVQHHHAHIAACMVEHGLDGAVIGFALDGTGYGTDGCVWGGEVLVAQYGRFDRVAHLEYVPLPGGAAAVREPWRMALSHLGHHFGRTVFDLDVPFVDQLDRQRAEVLMRMMERGVNAPPTSSCGRLFDAVAALVGVRDAVTYEAQAAIELEALLDPADTGDGYPFAIAPTSAGWVLGTRPLFDGILADLRAGVPAGAVSRRFHDGLIASLGDLASLVRERTGLDRVCFGGGTFHNVRILSGLRRRLERDGFEVFSPEQFPAGDGALSLGQAAVAAHTRS